MRSLYLALFSFVCQCALFGTQHLEHPDHRPQIVSRYRLIDVGETNVDASQLSRLSGRLTLATDINEHGFGTANGTIGGQVFQKSGWKYAPQISGMTINFHAINEKGDLLISLERGRDSVEWMVWPWRDGGYGAARKHIHTLDPFKSDLVLTGFNAKGMVVGYKKNDSKLIPIVWNSDSGMQKLGEQQGLDLNGAIKTINDKCCMAGYADEIADRYPFYWHPSTGMEVLKNYRSQLTPKGWIEFADLVLSSNDVVYGTFWIKHLSEGNKPQRYNPYYAYEWEPKTGKVSMIDLQGMRITAVNGSHTLVGMLNGKATIREKGKNPIELAALIDPQQQQTWQLIENTGINDKGQIVGYGTFEGKMHIFLADPT
jgi:hypothetical protein